MDKEAIIKKHWPKPSQSDSITAWKEAASKMMDEWAIGAIRYCESEMINFQRFSPSPTELLQQYVAISKNNQ